MKRFPVIIVKLAICFMLFLLNFGFCWDYVKTSRKVKIENEASNYFYVAIITPQGAELFLNREQMDEFLKTHKTYSYLVPQGQELNVQEQLRASYHERYNGKAFPSIKVEPIDADHQLIELYMNGDHRDEVLWYEASDKKIVPKYQMMISAFDMFPCLFISIILALIEYKIGKWLLVMLWEKTCKTGGEPVA